MTLSFPKLMYVLLTYSIFAKGIYISHDISGFTPCSRHSTGLGFNTDDTAILWPNIALQCYTYKHTKC